MNLPKPSASRPSCSEAIHATRHRPDAQTIFSTVSGCILPHRWVQVAAEAECPGGCLGVDVAASVVASTASGFTLQLKAGCSTSVRSFSVSWMAVAQAPASVCDGTPGYAPRFATPNISPWDSLALHAPSAFVVDLLTC